jgi:hypothetical protein
VALPPFYRSTAVRLDPDELGSLPISGRRRRGDGRSLASHSWHCPLDAALLCRLGLHARQRMAVDVHRRRDLTCGWDAPAPPLGERPPPGQAAQAEAEAVAGELWASGGCRSPGLRSNSHENRSGWYPGPSGE